jgi:VWFA-related protein
MIPAWWKNGCWGTALWNGVYSAARLKMETLTGRKALVVITDGWDRGSHRTLSQAIEAAQGASAAVYVIRSTSHLYSLLATGAGLSGAHERNLRRLAEETGGSVFRNRGDLAAIFDRIENDLRAQYVLAFTPAVGIPGYRRLQVTTTRAGLAVRARKGYYAVAR